MADIELVIKIPEEHYEMIQNIPNYVSEIAIQAVRDGIPLPKGHGRLIDADAELEGLRKMKVVDEKDKQSVRFAILNYEYAQTIIEADKAESEVTG